jgi:hypothetical protein
MGRPTAVPPTFGRFARQSLVIPCLLLPCARILSRGKSLLGHGQTKSLTYGRAEPVGNRLSCAETGVCSSRRSHKEGYQIILLKFIIPRYVCRNLFRPALCMPKLISARATYAETYFGPPYVCRNSFRPALRMLKFISARLTYAEIYFGPRYVCRNLFRPAPHMPKFILARVIYIASHHLEKILTTQVR